MARSTLLFLSGLLASAAPVVYAQQFGGTLGEVSAESVLSSSGSPSSSSSSSVSTSSSSSTNSNFTSSSTSTIDLAAIGLHTLAKANGLLFFGTATDTNLFNDSAYMQIVNDRNMFGILVPENSQKWQPIEPTQNNFQFNNSDRVHSLANSNQQMLRCHTLTWFQQLPAFVTTTAWTRATLTAAIQTHIANVVGHFKGACYSWDVVNEALNDNGTFRNSVFFQTLGTDFIPISFLAAAKADPNARLYYNDFNIEFDNNKTAAALNIVGLVRRAGARIDGVGFQGHMTTGQTPSRQAMANVFRKFTALDLEVAITELDVRQTSLPPSTAQQAQQATDYVSMVGGCLDVDGCVGVVAWEYTDRYSWIPSTFPGTGAACLFDENLEPKPAYTAVASLLAAKATGVPAGATIAGIGAGLTNSGAGGAGNGGGVSGGAGVNTNNNGGSPSTSSGTGSNSGSQGSQGSTANIPSAEFIGNFGGRPGLVAASSVNGANAGGGSNSGSSSSSASGSTSTASSSSGSGGAYGY
ncbi:Endo-1,4-beta-xylanase 5 [Sporothrix bragantina]|uniref:Beta-xylanase n=1 Tax=Sporothrix bragantina TaxID=671064 RepID=A0ABP0BYP2_9PEZI